jgi:uncharacterized protein
VESIENIDKDNFQILSLSGGGYLGLYQAVILSELENQIDRPIAQCFDLIAGTSIGGIIALALALEIPAQTIRDAFIDHGQIIFSDRKASKSKFNKLVDLSRFIFQAKYKQNGLIKVLTDLIDPSFLLGDLKHPVVIPSINLTKGQPKIFKTPHHRDFRQDYKKEVYKVALATSAAPTFFPLVQIDDQLFTDGGLCANMPDLVALHESEHFFGIPTDHISILSIGTTTSNFSFSHSIGQNLGAISWLLGNRLFSVILSSQQQITKFMMIHKLGDRYLRIDSDQSKEQQDDLGLDVATKSAQSTIKGLAMGELQNTISNPKLQKMLEHKAKQSCFYYGSQSNQDS